MQQGERGRAQWVAAALFGGMVARVGVTLVRRSVRPSPVRAPSTRRLRPEIAFGSDSFVASLPPSLSRFSPAARPVRYNETSAGRDIGGPGQGLHECRSGCAILEQLSPNRMGSNHCPSDTHQTSGAPLESRSGLRRCEGREGEIQGATKHPSILDPSIPPSIPNPARIPMTITTRCLSLNDRTRDTASQDWEPPLQSADAAQFPTVAPC